MRFPGLFLCLHPVELVSSHYNHGTHLKNIFCRLQTMNPMWNLLQIELYKISRKSRTYIAFIAITAIVFVFQFAFKADGKAYLDFMAQDVTDSFQFDKTKAING